MALCMAVQLPNNKVPINLPWPLRLKIKLSLETIMRYKKQAVQNTRVPFPATSYAGGL